jgi:REP element-mobilizing transposase RayT
MARQLRIEYPDAYYHVMNRGAARKRIFHDKEFYHLFLTLLGEIKEIYGVEIHAYCLMGNHYHLLLKTPRGNLSRAMKHLNSVYTLRHNRLLRRDGPLFRGRFKAILVDAENYLLHVSRYIHLNPVEANIVEKPESYPWSSFRYYSSKEKLNWLTSHEILNRFNVKNKINAYSAFVSEGIDPKTYKVYTSSKMPPIFGEDSFCNMLKIVPHQEIPDSKRIAQEGIEKEKIVKAIAKYYGCKEEEITSGSNMLLKKIGVYFCKRLTTDTHQEIGKYFSGLSYSGVSQIHRRMQFKLGTDKEFKKEINKIDIMLSRVKT